MMIFRFYFVDLLSLSNPQAIGLVRAMRVLWSLELHFETLHTDLEAVHSLYSGLRRARVVVADKAEAFALIGGTVDVHLGRYDITERHEHLSELDVAKLARQVVDEEVGGLGALLLRHLMHQVAHLSASGELRQRLRRRRICSRRIGQILWLQVVRMMRMMVKQVARVRMTELRELTELGIWCQAGGRERSGKQVNVCCRIAS